MTHVTTAPPDLAATPTELWQLGATDLANVIRSREASSVEVVESHLQRIASVNPAVNAITVVLGDEAIDAAKVADRAVAAGADLPPFHGVPFTVKENIDVVGTPTTHGARALLNAFPDSDAPVVERIRAAGGIPIGRTNLPTFALRWHCDSELYGATLNPWDPSRTPGASSGGEAVALATGMSPLGLGNDGLGSLRWPAQCCGVAALKPTLGQIPHATTIEPIDAPVGVQLTDVEGPMARRIADLRAAFEVMAGPSWRDPWTVPTAPRLPGATAARVAVVIGAAAEGTASQVQEGVHRAAEALEDTGYAIDLIEPPGIDAAASALLDMLATPDIRAFWDAIAPSAPVDTQRFMSAFFAVAGEPDPATSWRSFMARQSLLRAWGEFQREHPLIVAPISTRLPFAVGADLTVSEVAEIVHGLRTTLAVNALGLPAVALPVGVAGGLPQAVQVIGPRFGDALCLDAAAALELRLGIVTPIDPRLP